MIIAIDGHSSCGKSTIAKAVAKKFDYIYVDTGAMYRAVTLYCMQNGIINNGEIDVQKLEESLDAISISFKINPTTQTQETYLNNQNIETEIRGLEVSNNVSPVSKIKSVREKLVALQREFGQNGNIVMDGRDIGTVVFPNADKKFFITASAKVRAQRRFDELSAKGETVDFNEVLQNIESRDLQDSTRKESPLKQAKDAILFDNSNLTREEQMDLIFDLIIND